ncbi:hypothetical protein BH10ACT1_BH10ACT1_13490 [soil metagenome]
MVTTQRTRSDFPKLAPGQGEVRLPSFEPACSAGPCDLRATPAGHQGTFRAEGAPSLGTPAPPDPYTYTWDEAQGTYTSTVERVAGCTTKDFKTVEDAYHSSYTTTVTFRPPDGKKPPGLTGTYTQTVTSTPEAQAAGCTPFVDSGTIVGAPTGSLSAKAEPGLAGSYLATETVEKVEPSGSRPVGLVGPLGTFTVAAVGDGYVLTGLLAEPATLASGAKGYSGATAAVSRSCGDVADGFSSTETLTDLTPVALTEDGAPILAGRWKLFENPTAAGVDAGCSLASNAGYVVLVPKASVE